LDIPHSPFSKGLSNHFVPRGNERLYTRGERIKIRFRLRHPAEFLAPPVLLECLVAFQRMTPPRLGDGKIVSR